jgi:adenylate cyclase
VLPFVAMSSGKDDEYFADGLTEEILNSLSQLPELLVTARTSAFQYKGQDIPPLQEIAETLGVKNIVEGSVRRAGERLRVTAQLIRAEDGFHLWSENYDSTSEDTIAVQEDIAEKIALAMDVVMDDAKREGMRKAGLRDVEAFIAYQKGSEVHDQAHGEIEQIEGLRQANRYLDIVTERVPGFAPAHILHSDLYIHMLLNDASSQPMVGVTEQDLAQAMENASSDYEAAVRFARTTEERHIAELDLAFVTSNWRGLKGRMEVFLNETGCQIGNWQEPLADVFGYAEEMRPKLQELRECDPLYSSAWRSEVRTILWAGRSRRCCQSGQARS